VFRAQKLTPPDLGVINAIAAGLGATVPVAIAA